MPAASPFLNALLDRRGTQTRQARQSAEAKMDELRYGRRSLDDARILFRQRQSERLQSLGPDRPTVEARWGERLRRIEEWRARLDALNEECLHVDQLSKTLKWFQRAAESALPFNRRLHEAGNRLESRRKQARESLEDRQRRLEERANALRAFEEKAGQRSTVLLVSRARKRPDEVFVHQETLSEQQLDSNWRRLRRAAATLVGRLYKAGAVLEKRSQESPALFEIHKRHIEQDLQGTQAFLFSLRERILNDLLFFEGNRRALRWMQERVRRMRCVEDAFRAPPSRWRLWRDRLTF